MALWRRVPRDESLIVDPQAVIQFLEARQDRAIREALLTGDKTRLQEIEEDIAWLRELAKKRESK